MASKQHIQVLICLKKNFLNFKCPAKSHHHTSKELIKLAKQPDFQDLIRSDKLCQYYENLDPYDVFHDFLSTNKGTIRNCIKISENLMKYFDPHTTGMLIRNLIDAQELCIARSMMILLSNMHVNFVMDSVFVLIHYNDTKTINFKSLLNPPKLMDASYGSRKLLPDIEDAIKVKEFFDFIIMNEDLTHLSEVSIKNGYCGISYIFDDISGSESYDCFSEEEINTSNANEIIGANKTNMVELEINITYF